jgi:hypothetical protein
MGIGPRYPRAILASVELPWTETWEFQEDLFRDDPRFPLRRLPPYQSTTDEACARFVETVRERLPNWLPH